MTAEVAPYDTNVGIGPISHFGFDPGSIELAEQKQTETTSSRRDGLVKRFEQSAKSVVLIAFLAVDRDAKDEVFRGEAHIECSVAKRLALVFPKRAEAHDSRLNDTETVAPRVLCACRADRPAAPHGDDRFEFPSTLRRQQR